MSRGPSGRLPSLPVGRSVAVWAPDLPPRRSAAVWAAVVAVVLALSAGTLAPAMAQPAVAPPAPAGQLAPPPAPLLGPAPASWPSVLGIDAAAYVLVEGATGQVLGARDADVRRPVASVVKVLTALTVLERAALDDLVTVGDEVLGLEGSGVGLRPGDVWNVEDLVEALIARSGNDAAATLAVHLAGTQEAFTELMVADAVAMGLEPPTIVSPSGLDDANLLSAMDLATISRVALGHPELRAILGREVVTLPSEGPEFSRNLLLGLYPGATGVKTGFTAAAGNSLVGSAIRGDRELIAVVLGAGEDPARFELVGELLDLGFERTVRSSLDARLALAVGGGSVTLTVDPVLVTAPTDASVSLAVPLPARPPEGAVEVPIEVDAEVLGTTVAAVDGAGGPPTVGGDAAIGRAAADGLYAGLRAAVAAGRLG